MGIDSCRLLGNMPGLDIKDNSLEIELSFWEKVGSLTNSSSIKLSDINDVTAVDTVTVDLYGFRIAGTGLPGVAILGHYRRSKKRMMIYWVRGQQAIVLDLKNGPYQRMVIGCDDAKAWVKKLTASV